ncbi:unnamed protein product [Effrenium voratum]|nr:unnamed protein product [Effrenium voratum]
MSDRHLPVISRPASPEFPSLVRSRVPSQSQPALQSLPLVKASHSSEMSPQKPSLAASCPQLPGTKARMRREQEENNFLSRQQQHSGLQSRRQRSMMQRDILRKSQAAEDVEFLGSKGKEGFRTFLLKKFGTIISGWRALDADNSGRLGFVEFCQACRVVGFHGNFKKLWAELDVRGGMVCLADVDPEVSRYLSAFKKALVKKYGDLITAWFQCIDVHRDGQVQEPGFRRVVQLLGLDLNPSKLFNMLRSPSSKALTLLDFDPEAWKKHMAGEGPEGPEGPAVASSPKEEKKEKAAAFRQALSRRFGSLLHAWREELDPDGAGRVTFGEFCLVLSRLGLRGEVRSLWTELTKKDETGFLSFRDLDPQTDQMVSELREKLTQEFQNMLLAWIKGLDTRGTGLVSEKQFLRCCQKVGFTGDAKDLFHRLKPDAGRSLMTIQDFDTKAFHALSRGDFRMLSEPAQGYHGKSPLELTFHERNEAGFFYQARRAADAARRKEFAKACRTAQPAFCINTIEDFEDLCIRKHGSLIAAWRQCLDAHANGKLSFGEFCEALRRLGYAGDFKSLFKEYDKQQKGFICLADLDPEADLLVADFLALLGEHFETLDLAWRDGFHQDPHGSITRKDLLEACTTLRYDHDPEKLFKCLQPSPGKVLLTIWDLDPACSRRRRRGMEVIIPSAPRPLSPTARENEKKTFFLEDGSPTARSKNDKKFYTFIGPSPAQNLRQALRNHFGSTVAAWRLAFDPHFHGTCGFGMFMKVLEECSFGGKAQPLWQELSGEENFITLKNIDEPAASLMDSFREQLLGKFETIMDAWYKLEEVTSGLVDEEGFLMALHSLRIASKNPAKLFKLLLSRTSQRSVAAEDLQALLVGVPPEKRRELWGAPRPRKNRQQSKKAGKERTRPPKSRAPPERQEKLRARISEPRETESSTKVEFRPSRPQRMEEAPRDTRQAAAAAAALAVEEVLRFATDAVAANAVAQSQAEAAERSEASPYTSPDASPTASPEASPTASQGTNPSTKRKAAASLLKAAKNGSLAKSLDTFEEAQVEAAPAESANGPAEAEAAERSEASPYTSPGASPTASPEASPTSQGTNPSTKRKAAASLLKAAKNGSLAKSLDTFEEAQAAPTESANGPAEAEAAERSEASPYTTPGASPTASPEASPTSQGTNPSTKRKAAASLLKAAKNGSLAKSLDTFEEAQVEAAPAESANGLAEVEGA